MCQWNSDFPSHQTTIIKLKAKLCWKAAETLMHRCCPAAKRQIGTLAAPPLQMDLAAVSPRALAVWVRGSPMGLSLVGGWPHPEENSAPAWGQHSGTELQVSHKVQVQFKLLLVLISSSRAAGIQSRSQLCLTGHLTRPGEVLASAGYGEVADTVGTVGLGV